ncbi:MAG: type II toxin-antitoxin system VapC family toxin [Pseudomonadales bacterium]|jgi:PIN domain nuclease of toxin-antitoxin system|nr:type II toxin-antitoxin system VapC family toxin [Pseudomonadales bacterium]
MIVLDTHTLVWWVNGDPALSKPAKAAIRAEHARDSKGAIIVSAISAWEIALLIKRGRLALSKDLNTWLEAVRMIPAVKFTAVSVQIAANSVNLPGELHDDPADRIIIATAQQANAPLITKDERIRQYPHVKAIW